MTASMDERIAALAGRQHGVVTRSQLLTMGVTRRMVDSRLRAKRLLPLHRGVYRLGTLRGPLQPERAREMAAVLACGPGAVLSHRSAAWIWELLPRPVAGASVDVTVPNRARPLRPGIRSRSSTDLSPDETTVRGGIPVTTPGRTLRDLTTAIGFRDLGRATARAERRKLIDADDLQILAARQEGRPGAVLLRALASGKESPAFTRSEAEERFLDLVRRGGLPTPKTNVPVQGHEVDALWRDEGLAVEVDGFGFHDSRTAFENDRLRDAELAAVGIRTMRVTWRQIVDKPNETLVRVAQALVHGTYARRSRR